MFTGLVEEIGRIRSASGRTGYRLLTIACRAVLEGSSAGDSLAVDGVCQTITALGVGWLQVEALEESLRKTTLGSARAGRRVNLERAVSPEARLGGHLVQGHVGGTAMVREIRRRGDNVHLAAALPPALTRYCVPEGSIALDGVSLTIAGIEGDAIRINIIPATWAKTTLADRAAGDRLNVEVDLIARYLEALTRGGRKPAAGLSWEKLAAWGYGEAGHGRD